MAEYILSEEADSDLFDIYLFSHKNFGEKQTDKYLSELEECFYFLANNPNEGRDISDLRKGYFKYKKARHVIFYTVSNDHIFIVRVLHEVMKPSRHL